MTTMLFKQMAPLSKKDRITALIREAIIAGEIKSGDAIIESRLAQQLGVGQPAVREALIALEHQGFVQRSPYRGTKVTKLSREDVEQIFRLRNDLEALAAELARGRVTREDIKGLRELVEAMGRGAEEMDVARFYENDLAFHRRIWELSGNKYLVEALERIVIPLFAFFLMGTSRVRDAYIRSAADHMKIVDAMESMDAGGVRRLVDESLAHWKDEMLGRILPENE